MKEWKREKNKIERKSEVKRKNGWIKQRKNDKKNAWKKKSLRERKKGRKKERKNIKRKKEM